MYTPAAAKLRIGSFQEISCLGGGGVGIQSVPDSDVWPVLAKRLAIAGCADNEGVFASVKRGSADTEWMWQQPCPCPAW